MEDFLRVAMTGSDQAGKSVVCRTLLDHFAGAVVVSPEIATMLTEKGGFPSVPNMMQWSQEWQDVYQDTIYATQCGYEKAFELMARANGARIMITDRGLLDGAAYRPEESPADAVRMFCQLHNTTSEELLKRYAVVIHLETTAMSEPHRFGKAGNPVRFVGSAETDPKILHEKAVAKALRNDRRLREIYSPHPWYMFIPASMGVPGKINECIGAIRLLLAKKD